jgi:hypothetical protein
VQNAASEVTQGCWRQRHARLPAFGPVGGMNPDIGAYEVQQNDIVFDAGFDGCIELN